MTRLREASPRSEALGPQLALTREFAATPERLWQAWADPKEMVRWLGPVEWPASQVEADLRVGGAWRACLTARDGSDVLWQSGRYLDVNPPTLLRFTFRWDSPNHADAGIDTTVTIRLESLPGRRTRLTLTQTGLTDDQSIGSHSYGWSSTLSRLDQYLQP